MPFQVSPGVNVTEIDLTTVVPAVSTTEGAIAGVFRWGPIDKRILIDSEQELVQKFGKPTNHNPETFFTAANFLAYGNKLYVVRVGDLTSSDANVVVQTAFANVGAVISTTTLNVPNDDEFEGLESAIEAETNVRYIARYPGEIGNSLKVSVCDAPSGYSQDISLTGGDANLSSNGSLTTIAAYNGSNTAYIKISPSASGNTAEASAKLTTVLADMQAGDMLELGNSSIGKVFKQVTSVGGVTTYDPGVSGANATLFAANTDDEFVYAALSLRTNFTLQDWSADGIAEADDNAAKYVKRRWEYFQTIDAAPGASQFQATRTGGANTAAVDEVHVIVEDEDGVFTGVPGTILEAWSGLSRSTDAKTEDGSTNYYRTILNNNSQYIYVASELAGYSNTSAQMATLGTDGVQTYSMVGGSDGKNENLVSMAELFSGYDRFASAEDIDVSLILQGKARGGDAGQQLGNYLIDNIAESRKDCVAFLSPEKADVVLNAQGDESQDIVDFRNVLTSSSYGVLDSGYKYMYDKYNDIYRYVPLNGDMAGLAVRTDETRDPWWSPAGFNRGIIKNSIKLAFNPRKADRDILYKAGINPVVTFPGQGTLLFGDKTLLAKPSAFDRINVRRLFIVLEKAIATAAKFTLFEFNDEFTRAQFKNLVEPFLRDVQGRRGIYDFKVVCDETNNTGEVIDRNEFIGDIYIKPAKSINFIQLNFVAVRTGVEFSEIVGQF